ncbi:MAG TPA: deoxyribonuclease IV [Gemmatimonadaceae bacterium]|nr:deoxyribonuclease IV [Gemmatimonadaceae bacterium]
MPYLGAHTIDKGGIHMAVARAEKAGMTALQVFTAKPRFINDRISVRPERAKRFRDALAETRIDARHVLVHAPYSLSVANADEEKWGRASAGLTKELERSTQIGAGAVCFHPGNAGDGDRDTAAKRVAKAIVAALRAVDTETRLLVENTAGAGQQIGRTAAEVGAILSRVPDTLRPRTGYGLDTCHLFVSGYDLSASRTALAGVLDEFEEECGEPPAFFHLNDSAGELGSNLDRHVLIGEGALGKEPFRWLLQDKRAAKVPLILETPQKNYEVGDDDPTPDPWDVKMIKLLKGMAK